MLPDSDYPSTKRPKLTAREEPRLCGCLDQSLLHLPESEVYARLRSADWDFESAGTSYFTHGLYSYPAKFIPQIPSRLILALSKPRELVVDPFSGGGTAGVEALRLGRRFVGIDANPFAVLIGKIKTTPLPESDKSELRSLLHTIRALPLAGMDIVASCVPPIPNMSKWYAPAALAALSQIRQRIDAMQQLAARDVALAAFANTAAKVSFQDSESRYVSKPRRMDLDQPVKTFGAELDRVRQIAEALDGCEGSEDIEFRLGDARQRTSVDAEIGAAGLIVTSPPYPNAYDYHLYHRFRLFWLGDDPGTLRKVEIGSHLKHQAEAHPSESYESDMESVLENAFDILMPGRYCAIVVGDGIYRGERYRTSHNLATIAQDMGWSVHGPIERALPRTKRAVTSAGRRLMSEDILLLRRPPRKTAGDTLILAAPNYTRALYEDELAHREIAVLMGAEVKDDGSAVVTSCEPRHATEQAHQLALWHSVAIQGDKTSEIPTFQQRLEQPGIGKRKHSTYVTHGLHRYKGKFYPQLVKALLNLSEVPSHDAVVVDPFGGSGTVLLEAVVNGRCAVSIDCNPLATAVARSKMDILDVPAESLHSASQSLVALVASRTAMPGCAWEQFAPATHDELESWFAPRVLSKLAFLLEHVRAAPDPKLVAFYETIASDLIREVSQQEPRDLRIRRRRPPLHDAPVIELFCDRVQSAVDKIVAYHDIDPDLKPKRGAGIAVLGNSADAGSFAALDSTRAQIDCVVSSPPYATALPYIDTDRLSLAAIYGIDRQERRAIEERLIGSREISTGEVRELEGQIVAQDVNQLPDTTVTFLEELLLATRNDESAGFRKRQLPTLLLRYFSGVARVMHQIQARCRPGSHLWFVLGNSRTSVGGRQWTVPTVDEFTAIAEASGLEVVEHIPITVTREDVAHSKHSITKNTIVHLRAQPKGCAHAGI